MPADPIGGRYHLERPLGRSGMSEVWCAEDQELGRRVALKLLAPDADRARFDREARSAAALAHPNITQLYDYGEADGRPYMVLEYLAGGTLDERLTPGEPLPDDETARVAGDVAAGLAHAHAHGLVHRDLKPANILFDAEGRAKIADFGIARLAGAGTLTEAGTVLGTAAYISPEQAAGRPATPASDVYSFGVILYLLLTGRLPFVAENPLELVALHRDATPPSVEELRPGASPALAALADSSLAKDPAARPRNGAALVAALDTAGATVPLAAAQTQELAAPPAAAPPVARRSRRGSALAAALLALLALGGAALAFVFSHHGSGPTLGSAAVVPPTRKHRHSRSSAATTTGGVLGTSTARSSTSGTTTRRTTTRDTTTRAKPKRTTSVQTFTLGTTAPATTAPPPTTTAPPPTTTAPATTPVTT